MNHTRAIVTLFLASLLLVIGIGQRAAGQQVMLYNDNAWPAWMKPQSQYPGVGFAANVGTLANGQSADWSILPTNDWARSLGYSLPANFNGLIVVDDESALATAINFGHDYKARNAACDQKSAQCLRLRAVFRNATITVYGTPSCSSFGFEHYGEHLWWIQNQVSQKLKGEAECLAPALYHEPGVSPNHYAQLSRCAARMRSRDGFKWAAIVAHRYYGDRGYMPWPEYDMVLNQALASSPDYVLPFHSEASLLARDFEKKHGRGPTFSEAKEIERRAGVVMDYVLRRTMAIVAKTAIPEPPPIFADPLAGVIATAPVPPAPPTQPSPPVPPAETRRLANMSTTATVECNGSEALDLSNVDVRTRNYGVYAICPTSISDSEIVATGHTLTNEDSNGYAIRLAAPYFLAERTLFDNREQALLASAGGKQSKNSVRLACVTQPGSAMIDCTIKGGSIMLGAGTGDGNVNPQPFGNFTMDRGTVECTDSRACAFEIYPGCGVAGPVVIEDTAITSPTRLAMVRSGASITFRRCTFNGRPVALTSECFHPNGTMQGVTIEP